MRFDWYIRLRLGSRARDLSLIAGKGSFLGASGREISVLPREAARRNTPCPSIVVICLPSAATFSFRRASLQMIWKPLNGTPSMFSARAIKAHRYRSGYTLLKFGLAQTSYSVRIVDISRSSGGSLIGLMRWHHYFCKHVGPPLASAARDGSN
jgi:hypothetical protein